MGVFFIKRGISFYSKIYLKGVVNPLGQKKKCYVCGFMAPPKRVGR